ncbi:hypothetical protein FH965_14170 [Streptomyces spectabilis]|uniref:Uncharacterized protein n=1 Tax=Streptomyces spectabilis TaxID=68270 RepID=A0A516R7D4_STRST|nr:hypothetical protein FH965_14170 [Streptomyces spectabilis]
MEPPKSGAAPGSYRLPARTADELRRVHAKYRAEYDNGVCRPQGGDPRKRTHPVPAARPLRDARAHPSPDTPPAPPRPLPRPLAARSPPTPRTGPFRSSNSRTLGRGCPVLSTGL